MEATGVELSACTSPSAAATTAENDLRYLVNRCRCEESHQIREFLSLMLFFTAATIYVLLGFPTERYMMMREND
jgi:hypothetical protein